MLLPVLIYLIPRLGSVTGFGCGGVTEEGRLAPSLHNTC